MSRTLRSYYSGPLVISLVMFVLIPVAQAQWHTDQQIQRLVVQKLKQSAIQPESHPAVARANDVYRRISRGWDTPRILPALHIVDAADRVWAAAVDDGSIVMTIAAVELALGDGSDSGEARLAFVLAHELSHQRANHLWRQRYFQSTSMPHTASDSPPVGTEGRALVDNQERQADAEAVILLLLTGYDPFSVVGDSHFFDEWIAAAQATTPCARTPNPQHESPLCREASRRSEAARDQLLHVAAEATLFDLGMFALATTDYDMAIRYFEAFGRLFPAASVHANIGLAHLAMGQEIRRRIARLTENESILTDYPLLLRANPLPQGATTLRGPDDDENLDQLSKQLSAHAGESIEAFDKAIALEPDESSHYLYLSFSYILAGNLPMATGILQGKYATRFADSPASLFVSAHLAAARNQPETAQARLREVITQLQGLDTTPEQQSLLFSAYRNLAALTRQHAEKAQPAQLWLELASWSDIHNKSLLFALAREELRGRDDFRATTERPAQSSRLRTPAHERLAKTYPLWLDSEELQLRLYRDGRRAVSNDRGEIIAEWQRYTSMGEQQLSLDRLVARYGTPSHVSASSDKRFISFANRAVGFELQDTRVTAWFRYTGTQAAIQTTALQ